MVSALSGLRRDDRVVVPFAFAGRTCQRARTGDVLGWRRCGEGGAEAGILPDVRGIAEPR
jgi:hypothetical protein